MTRMAMRGGRLSGKVAVVFGAARGVGLATVKELLAEGAQVYASDIREPAEVVNEGNCSNTLVDATNEKQVNEFVESVLDAAGKVDILVTNVRRFLGKPLAETTLGEFDDVLGLTVRATFLGTRAVLPHMIGRRAGSIVAVSADGGTIGTGNDPIYNAAQHALVGMMKSVALAHAHQGIRANTVNPGAIEAKLTRATVDSAEQVGRQGAASTPASRLGKEWEVAKAVVFLASDESGFVNGIAMPVDGARSAGLVPDGRDRLAPEQG